MSDVPDGTYRAVVDRVKDGLAALEVTPVSADSGSDAESNRASRPPKWELLVDPTDLPTAARQADAVLSVTVADGSLASATHEPEATAERAETAKDRFERLSERPPTDGDSTGDDEPPNDGDDSAKNDEDSAETDDE